MIFKSIKEILFYNTFNLLNKWPQCTLHFDQITHTPCMTGKIFNQTLSTWLGLLGIRVLGWLVFFKVPFNVCPFVACNKISTKLPNYLDLASKEAEPGCSHIVK